MTSFHVTLVSYGLIALGAGLWAAQRTHNAKDFLLAHRRLGIATTALAHATALLPAGALVVIGAVAFVWGLSAIWLCAALLAGALLHWFYVAPRLSRVVRERDAYSLMEVLLSDMHPRSQGHVARSATLITLFCCVITAAAQIQAAGWLVATELATTRESSIVIAGIMVLGYVLIGGLWAAGVMAIVHAVVMLITLFSLLSLLLLALGSWDGLMLGLQALGAPLSSWTGGRTGVVCLAFVIGVSGVGLGAMGQPQLVNRLLAARSATTVWAARWLALGWMVLVLLLALGIGWGARVLFVDFADPQQVVYEIASQFVPPVLAGVLMGIVCCAVISAIDSQWLAVAASASVDLRRPATPVSLVWSRIALLAVALATIWVALSLRMELVEDSLLAWSAMGAAFGPLLLVRLTGKRIRPGSMLGAMWSGFILTFVFHVLPDAPGDILERTVPFLAALGVALTGGDWRHVADATPSPTVHDRLPI